MPPTFAALGVPAHLCDAPRRARHHRTLPRPGRHGPRRPRRPRRLRQGPHRLRQDHRLRPPAARPRRAGRARAAPRASCSCPPVSSPRRCRSSSQPLCWGTKTDGARRLRRRRHGAADQGARQGRRGRRRHPRPPQGPARPRLAAARRGRTSSSSTRPTAWPTWASCPRCKRLLDQTQRRSARRCCSRPRSTATSTC